MKLDFTKSFYKDLDNILLTKVKGDIEEAIIDVEKSEKLSEIKSCKKLKGHKLYYRIKIGDFRIGFSFENQIVMFLRVLPRKEIYRLFP